MTPSPRLEAALRYAAHGWPVLALVPGEKVPATRHGVKDATTDPDKIRWLWRGNPGRNVGIATGAPGPDVLDVDNHGETKNGFAALNKLKREGLVPQATAIVATPRGGLHLYFKGTGQTNGTMPRHHLDYRSLAGYVVAPPSQVNGRPYLVVQAPGRGERVRLAGCTEPARSARAQATTGTSHRTDSRGPGPAHGVRGSPGARQQELRPPLGCLPSSRARAARRRWR